MTPYEFIAKWRASELKERSASQEHFIDLCRLLGEPTPAEADPTGEAYCFERGARKDTGGDGWADVWKRHHFAWEYKGKRADLDAAFGQLRLYALALENPPLLIVSDMLRFRIRTNWTNCVSKTYEFGLDDLTDAATRDRLKWAFSDPERLRPARAKKLRDYLLRGQDQQDVFLPTSVLLATEKTLDFNSTTNVISFDPTIIGPLSVVDGQHRLEGLKMAAEKDPRLHTFIVPVNIAVNLPQLHQMCHFYIVNTTQKSVEESVGQCIVSRLTDSLDVENLPSLPKWIQNVVERGETNQALKLVEFLNTAQDSPWLGRIKMANDTRHKTHSIKQQSFVRAIVKYVLVANNPLPALNDFEKEKKIFLNYWKAISSLIDDAAGRVSIENNCIWPRG